MRRNKALDLGSPRVKASEGSNLMEKVMHPNVQISRPLFTETSHVLALSLLSGESAFLVLSLPCKVSESLSHPLSECPDIDVMCDIPDIDVIGISGKLLFRQETCSVNWIEGRGKSVVCEAHHVGYYT
ncbi:hypothetical protein Rs2_15851 [Raphanus sativus]|nr:hypothetical protein Rs2_15851 [Raphanus sativus]